MVSNDITSEMMTLLLKFTNGKIPTDFYTSSMILLIEKQIKDHKIIEIGIKELIETTKENKKDMKMIEKIEEELTIQINKIFKIINQEKEYNAVI